MFSGDMARGDADCNEALAVYRRIGDRRGEAWALQNLATIAFFRGDTVEKRITSFLPILPLPLELNYALIDRYPGYIVLGNLFSGDFQVNGQNGNDGDVYILNGNLVIPNSPVIYGNVYVPNGSEVGSEKWAYKQSTYNGHKPCLILVCNGE